MCKGHAFFVDFDNVRTTIYTLLTTHFVVCAMHLANLIKCNTGVQLQS